MKREERLFVLNTDAKYLYREKLIKDIVWYSKAFNNFKDPIYCKYEIQARHDLDVYEKGCDMFSYVGHMVYSDSGYWLRQYEKKHKETA